MKTRIVKAFPSKLLYLWGVVIFFLKGKSWIIWVGEGDFFVCIQQYFKGYSFKVLHHCWTSIRET